MEFGNDTTPQTQRTLLGANLLRTCYGKTGVTDFGLNLSLVTGSL